MFHRLPFRAGYAPAPVALNARAGILPSLTQLSGDRRGFALEATLIVMVLISALVAAAVAGTVIVQRAAGMDYRATRVDYAAEAGADNIMAQLQVAMNDGIISAAELAALTPPTLTGFTYPSITTTAAPAVPATIPSGTWAGLVGLNQRIDIAVTARDALNNQGSVIVEVNAQTIPLFQFGVFYEEDLEIHNGPAMNFAGWVHSNSNVYLSPGGGPTNFQSLITTPDSMFLRRKAANITDNNVWIDDAGGTAVRLGFDSRSHSGQAFVNRSNADFDGRVMTGVSGVTPLRLPLPTGMPPIEMIQPRNAGDTPEVQAVKFSWKATWHMTVDLAQLANVGVNCAGITVLPATRPVPTGPVECAMFRGLPDGFWDGRENIGADVFEIDVNLLHLWAQVAVARDASIIYVTFINSSAADRTRDYPVVRLINGSQLRFPMTLSTDRPLYIRGNFNTVGWQPASFISDAITFLSPGWSDAAHATTPPVGGRDPAVNWVPPKTAATAAMSVFAAIAAGHSATPCDVNRVAPACNPADSAPPPLTGGAYPNYGGGLENFPRFLEAWGGVNMVYRGSLVSLFKAGYARRRRWDWVDYYDPPTRNWAFDIRFEDPNNLPPGTPVVGSVVQTAYRPVY